MRILVENGCYDLRNIGDIAMLQTAVERLSSLWPHALIEVITDDPKLLLKYCPRVKAVPSNGRRIWFKNRKLSGGILGMIPRTAAERFSGIWPLIRNHRPAVARALLKLNAKYRGIDKEIDDLDMFLDALFSADIVVVSGAGFITDSFEDHTSMVLSLLEAAAENGKMTAMLSQGIGPIENELYRARVKKVLASVNLIAIREKRTSLPLLNSLEIGNGNLIVTGDDAIEKAYSLRASQPGNAIGVNTRVAKYSGVEGYHVQMIRLVLQEEASNLRCPLIGLPILLRDKKTSDIHTIKRILDGYNDSDGLELLYHPEEVMERTAKCRVVVTGSYHPAVFALSQGTPVVAFYNSPYYKDKFLGLAEQFGCGCEVISLNDKRFMSHLTEAINDAWLLAEELRPKLLEAAEKQIEAGTEAYNRLYEMLESRQSEIEQVLFNACL